MSIKNMPHGYPSVILSAGGRRIHAKIHRLVAEAFIPNPEGFPCIDHIDTNRANNNVENLRWVDYKGNSNNPLTIEKLRKSSSKKYGAGWKTINTRNKNNSCHAEVPVCQYKLNGELVAEYRSIAEAREATNIQHCTLVGAIHGKFKQAGGYLWAKLGEAPTPYIPNTPSGQKTVFQYDLSGEYIREWVSAASADRYFSKRGVSRCAIEKKRPFCGYWWSYEKKENLFSE